MRLKWEQNGLATLRQAMGEHGFFKIDMGPYGVRLYFEQQFLGLWHSINADIDDLAAAKAHAQTKEDSGETKEWI